MEPIKKSNYCATLQAAAARCLPNWLTNWLTTQPGSLFHTLAEGRRDCVFKSEDFGGRWNNELVHEFCSISGGDWFLFRVLCVSVWTMKSLMSCHTHKHKHTDTHKHTVTHTHTIEYKHTHTHTLAQVYSNLTSSSSWIKMQMQLSNRAQLKGCSSHWFY